MKNSISIILPTLNEKLSVVGLVSTLHSNLDSLGVRYEIIVVDDNSPDGTADIVRDHFKDLPSVKVLQRYRNRGLSESVIDGATIAAMDWILVMDADGQHDPKYVKKICSAMELGSDIVVASRHLSEIAYPKKWSFDRKVSSRIGGILSRMILSVRCSDPMSGFFAIRKQIFLEAIPKLTGSGFKILFDVLANISPKVSIIEIPYEFALRNQGLSKFDFSEVVKFYSVLIGSLGKRFGIDPRFAVFSSIGCFGALFHFLLLYVLIEIYAYPVASVLLLVIFLVSLINFIGNNLVTFGDKSKIGFRNVITGAFQYFIITALGGAINYSVAVTLLSFDVVWWISAVVGAIGGVSWNYLMSRSLVWK